MFVDLAWDGTDSMVAEEGSQDGTARHIRIHGSSAEKTNTKVLAFLVCIVMMMELLWSDSVLMIQ